MGVFITVLLIILNTLPQSGKDGMRLPMATAGKTKADGAACPEDPQQGSGWETVPLAPSLYHIPWFGGSTWMQQDVVCHQSSPLCQLLFAHVYNGGAV